MRRACQPAVVLGLGILVLVLVGAALANVHRARSPGHASNEYRTPWTEDLFPDDPNRSLRLRFHVGVGWNWENVSFTYRAHRSPVYGEDLSASLFRGTIRVSYRFPTDDGSVKGERNATSRNLLNGVRVPVDLPENRTLDLTARGELRGRIDVVRRDGNMSLETGNLTWNGSLVEDQGNLHIRVPAATPLGSRLEAEVGTTLSLRVHGVLKDPDGVKHRSAWGRLGPLDGGTPVHLGYEVGNREPRLDVAEPSEGAEVESPVTIQGEVEDPDGDPVTISLMARGPQPVDPWELRAGNGTWSTSLNDSQVLEGRLTGHNWTIEVQADDEKYGEATVVRNVSVVESVSRGASSTPAHGVGLVVASVALAAAARGARPSP